MLLASCLLLLVASLLIMLLLACCAGSKLLPYTIFNYLIQMLKKSYLLTLAPRMRVMLEVMQIHKVMTKKPQVHAAVLVVLLLALPTNCSMLKSRSMFTHIVA